MEQTKNPTPIFHEEQHFKQAWIMLVVFGIAGLQWYAAVVQLLQGKPFGENPMSDLALFIYWIVFGIGLPILFIFSSLTTEVRNDGVYFRFLPFHRTFRKIAFKELDHIEKRTLHTIRQYRGWGLRWQYKGMAYLVSGNQGVQFELMDGKRILIGSQRAEEFWQAIPAKIRARTGEIIQTR